MIACPPDSWIDTNQRLLVAEFSRLKQQLGAGRDGDDAYVNLQSARAAMCEPSAIDRLCAYFALSPFERDVLLFCAGVEMDAQLAAQTEIAGGESRRPCVTFGLSLAALQAPHWSALAPVGPLRRWRLVEVDESSGLAQGRLRIDERILHYLAGVNYLDARLQSLFCEVPQPTGMAVAHTVCAAAARDALATTLGNDAVVVWLCGDDADGQADVAATVAAHIGIDLQLVRAEDVPSNYSELDALVTLWEREALLLASALLVRCTEGSLPAAAVRFIERVHGPVFVAARQVQPLQCASLRFTVDKPDPLEQKQLWQQALGSGAERLNGALDGVAGQFRLSARAIRAESTQLAPAIAGSGDPAGVMWSAARSLGRSKLDELAERIAPVACWDDLILPDAQKNLLQQIGAHVRNRLKVYLEWGFAARSSRGLGISALFAGESGTGKTMAAEVLCRELNLDLYRIDLSAVVSKYIGETEKNLRRVFDAAEESGAILLFDEADALFGKRSEVKDSHDRYANIEISYLLQRMESYRGLSVLTSNVKAALDSAFQRRLRFVVQFPFPDQAQREAIWRSIFPGNTPRSGLEFAKLARLNVTGGSIRNIAINAAFRAAELNEPVSMTHLLQAAHHEASKRERPLSDAETRGWV